MQQQTFGRELHGAPALLRGYRLSMLEITDADVLATSGQQFHPVITFTGDPGDEVKGTVLLITPDELARADEYEVEDYQRRDVVLASGEQAWAYVRRETP